MILRIVLLTIFLIVVRYCADTFADSNFIDDMKNNKNKEDNDDNKLKTKETEYMGEKFPVKYLELDNIIPTVSDFDLYLNSLNRTIIYMSSKPNVTDCNRSLGLFYMKVVLKRTLRDYGNKMQKAQRDVIAYIIERAESVLSHYIYINQPYGWLDDEYRVSVLFKDDSAQIHSIKEFNRNKLRKWILSKGNMNEFVEAIDDGSLPKEKYAELCEETDLYYIAISESDMCLSRIAYNPIPIDMNEMQPCKRDEFCFDRIHSSPSIAYALSHRLLNMMMPHHIRRCYWISQEKDDLHMDILCAFMYRESVYIARRGFFARDIFLEHIALCGILGYEEFHRTSWFRKITTWINNDNCMKESPNFEINRSKIYLDDYIANNDEKLVLKLRNHRDKSLRKKCHIHQTSLLSIVLAHAIRHAAHFLSKIL